MEEMEITSWQTLDAVKKKADIVETIGNLQSGHAMSVFCVIEDDYLELCYSDSASNVLRRFEDREEFDLAIEQRKEENGEASCDDTSNYDEDNEDEEEELEMDKESDNY